MIFKFSEYKFLKESFSKVKQKYPDFSGVETDIVKVDPTASYPIYKKNSKSAKDLKIAYDNAMKTKQKTFVFAGLSYAAFSGPEEKIELGARPMNISLETPVFSQREVNTKLIPYPTTAPVATKKEETKPTGQVATKKEETKPTGQGVRNAKIYNLDVELNAMADFFSTQKYAIIPDYYGALYRKSLRADKTRLIGFQNYAGIRIENMRNTDIFHIISYDFDHVETFYLKFFNAYVIPVLKTQGYGAVSYGNKKYPINDASTALPAIA